MTGLDALKKRIGVLEDQSNVKKNSYEILIAGSQEYPDEESLEAEIKRLKIEGCKSIIIIQDAKPPQSEKF
jgi:hypothetical protein